MKVSVLFLTLVVINSSILNLTAQTPQSFKYQTVIRNDLGEIISGENVTFRFSILKGSITGEAVYIETHSVQVSEYGVASLEIGDGIPLSATIGDIDWAIDSYFLQIELDIDNSGQFVFMGINQLLSVPYALFAENVANHDDDWIISDDNMWSFIDGNVAIGMQNPVEKFQVNGNIKTEDTLKFKGFVDAGTGSTNPGLMLINQKDIKIGYHKDNFGNVLIGNSQYGKTVFDVEMTGNGNIGIGTDVFHETNSASYNVCIGMYGGYNLSSGNNNVFLGPSAGEHIETGDNTVCIGNLSGTGRNGNTNIFIGNRAGYSWDGGGNDNVILGNYAGFSYYASNFRNVFIGNRAGYDVSSDDNIFIGPLNTGRNSTGSKNIFFGYEVGKNFTGSNTLMIDNEYDNLTPFIKGDMQNDHLEINADLVVNGSSTHQSLKTETLLNLEELVEFPSSPTEGDFIYLNDTLRFYNGENWKKLW